MKRLAFIHGAAGVGKSTACALLHRELPHSAWLESEWVRMINPFVFTDETAAMTERHLSFLLRGYLECSLVSCVLFNWGLHGPRQAIWKRVRRSLEDLPFELLPITLRCSREEHIRRMRGDGRDEERIRRSLETRRLYEGLGHPVIDTSNLTPAETVERLRELILPEPMAG